MEACSPDQALPFPPLSRAGYSLCSQRVLNFRPLNTLPPPPSHVDWVAVVRKADGDHAKALCAAKGFHEGRVSCQCVPSVRIKVHTPTESGGVCGRRPIGLRIRRRRRPSCPLRALPGPLVPNGGKNAPKAPPRVLHHPQIPGVASQGLKTAQNDDFPEPGGGGAGGGK